MRTNQVASLLPSLLPLGGPTGLQQRSARPQRDAARPQGVHPQVEAPAPTWVVKRSVVGSREERGRGRARQEGSLGDGRAIPWRPPSSPLQAEERRTRACKARDATQSAAAAACNARLVPSVAPALGSAAALIDSSLARRLLVDGCFRADSAHIEPSSVAA